MKKLYITEEEVIASLSMAKAMELVEGAFRQLADGSAINHPRRRVVLPTGSILNYMAAGTPDFFGIKVYSTNPKSGAHFEVLLYRSEDGVPLATFEANHLGQIRTGAASGVATKFMAREDATVAGIVGSGFQAERSSKPSPTRASSPMSASGAASRKNAKPSPHAPRNVWDSMFARWPQLKNAFTTRTSWSR